MNRLKTLLLALMLASPEIGRADAAKPFEVFGMLGGSLVRGAMAREMAEFGKGTSQAVVNPLSKEGKIELGDGFALTMVSVRMFLFPERVLVIASLSRGTKKIGIYELEVFNGKAGDVRTLSEDSPGWSHEKSSASTAGNDGGDSM